MTSLASELVERTDFSKRVEYNLPPTARGNILSRLTTEFSSQAREYKPDENQIIKIPVNTNGFIDGLSSYIKMKVKKSNHDSHFDIAGVHSLIKNLRISTAEGKYIEDLRNYNVFACMMTTIQTPEEWNSSTGFYCEMRPQSDRYIEEKKSADADAYTASLAQGKNVDYTVCFHLMSGFLNNKFLIPAKYCPFTIELELAPSNVALVSADVDASVLTITDPVFVADIVNMSPDFYKAIEDEMKEGLADPNRGIYLPYSVWYQNQFKCSAKSEQYQVNLKSSDMKEILFVNRLQANVADKSKWSLSDFKYLGTDELSIQIQANGQLYPQKGMNSPQQCYIELMKSLCYHNDLSVQPTYLNGSKYESTIEGKGKFICGIDLELDNLSGMYSGISTSSDYNVNIMATQSGAAGTNHYVDVFANLGRALKLVGDSVLILE